MRSTAFLILTALILSALSGCHKETREEQFADAVEIGDFMKIEKMLNGGFDPDKRIELNGYPVIQAAEFQQYESERALLDNGANPDTTSGGETALIRAAWKENIPLVKLLLKHKAKTDVIDNDGYTALCSAVYKKNVAIAKLLLEAGADPDAGLFQPKDKTVKYWPLTYALYTKQDNMIELLLKHGADLNKTDDHGKTVLMKEHYSWNHLSLIKAARPNYNIRDNRGQNLIFHLYANYIKPPDSFIKKFININQQDYQGYTAYLWEIESEFDYRNSEDYDGDNMEQELQIEWLFNLGVDVNPRTKKGVSPFTIALKYDDYTYLAKLLEHGLRIENVMTERLSPEKKAAVACTNGDLELLESAVSEGLDPDVIIAGAPLIFIAARNGHLELLKYLHKNGANMKASTASGMNAAVAAAKGGELETLKYCIQKGNKVKTMVTSDRADDGWIPETLFYSAVEGGNVELMAYLIKKGAKFDKPVLYGRTPLHLAIELGNFEAVKLLVEKGANVNNETVQYDYTPLSEAMYYDGVNSDRGAIYNYLVDNGARIVPGKKWQSQEKLLNHALSHCGPEISSRVLDYQLENKLIQGAPDDYDSAATEYGDRSVFEQFVEAIPDYKEKNAWYTFINICKKKNYEGALYFLESGLIRASELDEQKRYRLMESALDTGEIRFVELFAKYGFSISTIPLLAKPIVENRREMVSELIDLGADVNLQTMDVKSPLLAAVNNPYMTELLLKRGADPNKKTQLQSTYLTLCAKHDIYRTADILIKYGADVNAVNKDKKSPLLYAVENGSLAFVQLLLDAKADPNMADQKGRTPLFAAVEEGLHPAIVKALVEGGADIKREDKDGKTAVQRAKDIYSKELKEKKKRTKEITYRYLKSL